MFTFDKEMLWFYGEFSLSQCKLCVLLTSPWKTISLGQMNLNKHHTHEYQFQRIHK